MRALTRGACHVLVAGWLQAQQGAKGSCLAIFTIGFAKERDREAAASWVVWSLSVGAQLGLQLLEKPHPLCG